MIEIARPKTKKMFICCIYRAPNNSLDNYLTELNNVIAKLPNNSEFILLGDFNVVIPCSLSDHSLVFCMFKTGVPKAPPQTIEYRS